MNTEKFLEKHRQMLQEKAVAASININKILEEGKYRTISVSHIEIPIRDCELNYDEKDGWLPFLKNIYVPLGWKLEIDTNRNLLVMKTH